MALRASKCSKLISINLSLSFNEISSSSGTMTNAKKGRNLISKALINNTTAVWEQFSYHKLMTLSCGIIRNTMQCELLYTDHTSSYCIWRCVQNRYRTGIHRKLTFQVFIRSFHNLNWIEMFGGTCEFRDAAEQEAATNSKN